MNEMREQALQRDLVCSGVEVRGSWIGEGNRYVDGFKASEYHSILSLIRLRRLARANLI